MKNKNLYKIFLVIGFVILYSLFVIFINVKVEEYSEFIVATVFFFALFSGFFITRQNDRYSQIGEYVSENDGLFSYLYRISGFEPRIQDGVREIIRNHYKQILATGDWAYHLVHPSTTITDLTKKFGSISKEEFDNPSTSSSYEIVWDVMLQLQVNRKKLLHLFHEKLLIFQWVLIYVLGILLVVSFDLIPDADLWYVNILKVIFGTSVFLTIILLKQLNDLTIFGKDFAKKTANDVIRILDEKDAKEVREIK